MRQPLVAGNWKLNGSLESIAALVDGIKKGMGAVAKAEVAVCPPSIYVQTVTEALKGSVVQCGGQNCSEYENGAYTGEISAAMIKDFGCKYVILGHSERRSIYGETDQQVADKVKIALASGLIPIFCVGELLEERESGDTENVVGRQMDAVLNTVGADAFSNIVVAYEPVWAIGTGMTASPQQAQDVHAFIRTRVAAQNTAVASELVILYGGSVKPDNAEELFSQTDIDGGLIGGASLEADTFLSICRAAN